MARCVLKIKEACDSSHGPVEMLSNINDSKKLAIFTCSEKLESPNRYFMTSTRCLIFLHRVSYNGHNMYLTKTNQHSGGERGEEKKK